MNFRVSRKEWLAVGATVGLLAAVWLMGTTLAQGDVSLAAMVADKINYQGRLTDTGGTPLDGTYPMRFEIYDIVTGGTSLWDSGIVSVDVDQGLFNVELAVDPADFNGQALWLRIYVDGDWLSPRQELVPVPYALSLRPGAQIVGAPTAADGWVLKVDVDGFYPLARAVSASATTGSAIRGESAGGYGLWGYSDTNWAVVGRSDTGMGGNFQSNESYGIRANTDGNGSSDHAGYFTADWGFGIYAVSDENAGVRAEAGDISGASQPAGQVGVVGIGEDRGVSGTSRDGEGVTAYSVNDAGVYGRSEHDHGVYGQSYASSGDAGYAGYFVGENYRGLYAEGESGWYDAYFGGSTGIYVVDDIVAGGSKAGYVVDIALNDGRDSLELGDVVVITGAAEPVLGSIPVPRVRKASSANSTGVIGVVDRQFVTPSKEVSTQETEAESPGYFADSTVSMAEGGGIARGEYVGVVTLGSFRAIKVDASYGAIQPGDLLVSSDNPGYAMRATNPQVGTVIGKALGSLDSGTGVIPVLITLQ